MCAYIQGGVCVDLCCVSLNDRVVCVDLCCVSLHDGLVCVCVDLCCVFLHVYR